ncbi:hypothetical protein GQR58_005066 [Nymphon striatum]|nr:hypothetical protein GQR58_005066 [Nymphon striatum]
MLSTAFAIGALPAFLNLTVDPYQMFSEKDRPTAINDIAEKAHYPLWKLAKFSRGSHDTIILGDSRARALRDKYWHELKMPGALNLAYGGGTIPEVFSTFSVIKSDPAIRNLIIGVQLRSFDEDHKGGMNRVPEAVELVRYKLEYLKNWNVFQTTMKVFKKENEETINQYDHYGWGSAFPNYNWDTYRSYYEADYQNTKSSKKFERQVLKNWTGGLAQAFEFSKKYWKHFEEIGHMGKINNKNLVFVIPPTITNLQNTIQKNGLGKLNHQLRVKLAELGTVVDLDFPNKLTEDVSRFNDAYHFNSKVARQIVGQVIPLISKNKDALKKVIVTSALSLHEPVYTSHYLPDPIAQRELSLAKNYAKNKDWQKAAEILSRNAVGSNRPAKYEYALLYIKGWGVPRDLEKARNLLLQAVQRPFKDRAKAAFELGRVYRMSKGEDCSRIAFEVV